MHVSLSTVLLLLWSLLLAPTIFGQNVNPNFLVTSSRNCLSNVDCPSTSFCGRFYFSSRYPGFKCIPRLRVNASCVSPSLAGECRPGLYCSSRGRVCRKQTPANSRCLPLDPMQCLGRLTCKSSTRRCGQPGAVGFKCTSDTDCRPAFYCARDRGRCVRREGPGTTCRPRFFRQCSGFCATSVANPSRGVCLPSRNDGGACTRTVQCLQADPASQKRGNFRVCNVARGYVGICLRETLQLKQLGVACSPKRDRCDADRGLACRWAGKKRGFVCQQRASVTDVGVTRFCTPKSPLSACLPIDGIPQECRRERENDFTTPYDGLYACLRETEFLPVGSICDHVEYALCASGTVCLPVPGISRKFLPRTPVKYCLIIRQLGEPCGGKFFSRCADGLKCVNGKCVKGTPTVGKVTHAYLNGDCTKLPCARGLVCAKPVAAPASSPLRICQFPVRIVDINRPCYDTARVRRVCKSNLICSRNSKSKGRLQCRRRFSVGGVCTSQSSCKSGLQCSVASVEPPFFRRCYNPKKVLPLGAACNPKGGLSQNRCVQARIENVFGFPAVTETRCLPKGTGFTCQLPARLYERCSAQKNVGCVGNSFCGAIGYCIPRL